jgi:hypothetical protein
MIIKTWTEIERFTEDILQGLPEPKVPENVEITVNLRPEEFNDIVKPLISNLSDYQRKILGTGSKISCQTSSGVQVILSKPGCMYCGH